MFRKFVETVVGGAAAFAALFVVAKLAYRVGQETERDRQAEDAATRQREEVEGEEPNDLGEPRREVRKERRFQKHWQAVAPNMHPEASSNAQDTENGADNESGEARGGRGKRKRQGMLGAFLSAIGMRRGAKDVIGELVREPEKHKLEAYLDGGEVHIFIRRRQGRGALCTV